ncbi:hypothetical protein MTO96_050298 [Rhipicephalus appendiculatus]
MIPATSRPHATRCKRPALLSHQRSEPRDGHCNSSNQPTRADRLKTRNGTSTSATNTACHGPPSPGAPAPAFGGKPSHDPINTKPCSPLNLLRNSSPQTHSAHPTRSHPTTQPHTSPPHKKRRCSDSVDDYQADLRNTEAKFDANLVALEARLEDKFSTLVEQLSNRVEQQMNATNLRPACTGSTALAAH